MEVSLLIATRWASEAALLSDTVYFVTLVAFATVWRVGNAGILGRECSGNHLICGAIVSLRSAVTQRFSATEDQ